MQTQPDYYDSLLEETQSLQIQIAELDVKLAITVYHLTLMKTHQKLQNPIEYQCIPDERTQQLLQDAINSPMLNMVV